MTAAEFYSPLALREDNRHPIMLLATLGSVTLAWMSTLMRDGKLDRKESGRPSSSSWKLRIIFCRNKQQIMDWSQQQEKEAFMFIQTLYVCRCSYLSLGEILLTVRFVVFLLHEGNPAQLAFLDEGLHVYSAKSITADPLIILQHETVIWTHRQEPSD